MPLSTTPRLAFGLNTRPPRSYSCVYHLASLPAEAFGCVIGVSFGAEFSLGPGFSKFLFFSSLLSDPSSLSVPLFGGGIIDTITKVLPYGQSRGLGGPYRDVWQEHLPLPLLLCPPEGHYPSPRPDVGRSEGGEVEDGYCGPIGAA